jgi:Ca2+-binding RTX toxin-like protein
MGRISKAGRAEPIAPIASVPDGPVISGILERLHYTTPDIVEGDGDGTILSGDVIEMSWIFETFSDFGGPYLLHFGSDIVVGDPVGTEGGDDLIAGDAIELTIDASFFPEPPVPFSDITITVHGGDDRIIAAGGNDVASGDFDNVDLATYYSAVSGSELTVTIDGGDDVLRGGDGRDVLTGDIRGLYAETSRDESEERGLILSGGDDRLFGGADDDVLFGDIGDDGEVDPSDPNSTTPFDYWAMPAIVYDSTFLFIGGDDVLDGRSGNDIILGDANGFITYLWDDSVTEWIMGDDVLIGGAGDDTLIGDYWAWAGYAVDLGPGGEKSETWGQDRLEGGTGNDTMTGDAFDPFTSAEGATDHFVFATGSGHDIITDFQTGIDVIDVKGYGFQDVSEIGIVAQGDDTLIILDGSASILLQSATIAESDFLL